MNDRNPSDRQPSDNANALGIRGVDGKAFRWTAQRREVYDLLMGERDHPTANELFIKAQQHVPGISLATVYNSLEAMTQAGLVKQVNIDRSPSRYCPNLRPHAHLLREDTGEVIDVPLKAGASLHDVFDLPEGVEITAADITFKGVLRDK